MKQDHNAILIVGAGVAGLTAALALAARGFPVKIFEKSRELSEVGAGLQLSPNATRLLDRLGVLDRLMPSSVVPDAVFLQDGLRGGTILRMPLGETARKRWGAPYIVCHRADLQRALLDEARAQPNITLYLGTTISQINDTAGGVVVRVEQDNHIQEHGAQLLIAADGVWSHTRNASGRSDEARFTGHVAWRTTVKPTDIPPGLLGSEIGVMAWVGPSAHLIAYPVRAGSLINLVVITSGEAGPKQWANASEISDVRSQFSGWTPAIRSLIEQERDWTCWPLYEMPTSRFVINAHTVLIGDAAHALPPFAAQGAAMAIEDACALANHLSPSDPNWSQALKRFETARAGRVQKVAKRGSLNRFVYHASGPVAFVRNRLMQLRPAESFAADLDWLYSFDADALS